MNDPELIRFIRQEIRREMNVVLSGSSGDNSKVISEDIENMYPGMPTITERPVMHPYGLVSRAPKGTIQVVAKQGEHTGNRIVLGHRAKDRKDDLEEGETYIYNADGELVMLKKGQTVFVSEKLLLGSKSASEPLMLGKKTQSTLSTILGLISDLATQVSTHVHPTAAPGPPSPPPTAPAFVTIATQATTEKSSNVESGAILSDKAFTEK